MATRMPPLSTNHWRQRAPAWILGGAAAIGLLAAPALFPRAAARTPPAVPAAVAMTVTVASAQTVEWPESLSATGAIEPWQEAVISSQSTDLRLVEVRVNVGDAVRKGDLLARFDDRRLRAEEAQLQAALSQAEASSAQAEANRRRALQQRAGGGISEQDILAHVTQARIAMAQVAAIRAQLAAKRLQWEDSQVRAPEDGIVSARRAALGAVANPGQELFRVIVQGRLEWRGELTAAQLARARPGLPVELILPDGQLVTGTVRQQAPALDSARRLGMAYVDLPPGSAARAGMYAKGNLLAGASAALVVPAASVVIRDGHSYVFTLAGGGAEPWVARMTPVVIGRRRGAEAEVREGLAAGAQVVAQGAGFLDEGDRVALAVTPGAAGAAP